MEGEMLTRYIMGLGMLATLGALHGQEQLRVQMNDRDIGEVANKTKGGRARQGRKGWNGMGEWKAHARME